MTKLGKVKRECPCCGKTFEIWPSSLLRMKHCSMECRVNMTTVRFFEQERISPLPKMIGKKKDHSGERFGMLVAISLASNTKAGAARWLCKCDCGNERIIPADTLVKGRVNSCGCMTRIFQSANCTTHGQSRHTGGHRWKASGAYQSWHSMRQRCEKKTARFYKDYGGRGITVCKEWSKFENFYADMGDRPQGMTLDRINNDGNYEPGNCKWATMKEQTRNRRTKIKNSDLLDLVRAIEVGIIEPDLSLAIQNIKIALSNFKNRKPAAKTWQQKC